MKRIIASFAVLVLFVLPLAAQERADTKPSDDTKAPVGPPPRAVYQHTTTYGHLGKFELNGERGKADYYFNGQHREDDLVYVRSAQMQEPSLPNVVPGWVYQVSSKDKKESIWFLFGAEPLVKGGDQYPMFYSTTPPNQDGKQPWMRIRTPGGTKRTAPGKGAKADEEPDR